MDIRKLKHEYGNLTSSELVSLVCFLEYNSEPSNSIKAEDFLINRMTVHCSWQILYHDGCLVDLDFFNVSLTILSEWDSKEDNGQ